MTSTSWEHQREVRDALRTIVTDPQLGTAALSSAQTMSNLLKDLLPDAPRETSVLVAAAEAGLAQTLLDHVGQGMDVVTASSLAASAFAARTPFTTDACNWAVGELAVALGLARGEPPPGGQAPTGPAHTGAAQAGPVAGAPPPGGRPAGPAAAGGAAGESRPGVSPYAAGDRAETILPPRNAGQGARPDRAGPRLGTAPRPVPAPPGCVPAPVSGAGRPIGPGAASGPGAGPAPGAGYGYPGANPAARAAAPGAQGMAPPTAVPPGAGYGYPPPPAPGAAAGYRGYPGRGAVPGYAYPPRPVPGTVPGQGPKPSRTPKAWMILTACVAIVALVGGIAALARHDNSSNGTTIEPLSQLIKPDVTSCKSTVTLGMTRLTHREFCQTSVHSIGLDAYQFATASAYANGLSLLNTVTGWSPSGAGTGCPPPSGNTSGQTQWHSNVNSNYPQRAGQILECYSVAHPSFLLYLWTLPTQRVILVANDNATGATFTDLEKWWSGLNYG